MILKIGILGCSGKMGRELVKAAISDQSLILMGGSSASSTQKTLGEVYDISSCKIPTLSLDELFQKADVLIDFSTREASLENAKKAEYFKKALVIGTTGFSEEELKELKRCKSSLFLSYNMSLGINVLQHLVKEATRLLGSSFDIEIIDVHHKHKKDAPSGTSFMIQNSIGKNVPIHSVRGGSISGDHTVLFLGESERLEIKHVAEHRSIFAKGAIDVAKWLVSQPVGFYSMEDFMKNKNT